MAPQSGTPQLGQDLLLSTGDPVGKLLGQWSAKGVFMDQVASMPTPAFKDTSGPLNIRDPDSQSLLAGREHKGPEVTCHQHVDLLIATLRGSPQPPHRHGHCQALPYCS